MDLTRLRAFVALADRLHFGETARQLNVSQPALSKQIRQLEDELGGALFERGRHGARLTEAGRAFVEEARELVRHAERVTEHGRRAARGEIGRLSIGFGFSTLVIVPRVVSRFRRRFPGVDVSLRDMATLAQINALRAGRLDVGFVRLPVGTGLEYLEVVEERFALAVPKERARELRTRPFAELRDEPFIVLPRTQAPSFYDHVIAVCEKHGFRPEVIQEAAEFPTMFALVAAGLGLAFVPESAIRTKPEGVSIRHVDDPEASWRVGAAWRPDRASPIRDTFVAMVRDELGR